MARYQCHKVVEAEPMSLGSFNIEYDRNVGGDPAQEGYKVTYADGYTSWSPKGAFEDGYTLLEG